MPSKKNEPSKENVVQGAETQMTRTLCVLLVTQAVVSYRSIPHILSLFNTQTPLNLSWIPHFSSVINWSLRLGLGLLKQVKPITQPWLAIVDHSIDVGTKKALVVLRVKLDILAQKRKALQLSDCECIGLRVAETVNGDTIALELKEIFAKSGTPLGIIKDREPALKRGVRLWSQAHAPNIEVIDDISHVMATALKKQYEKSTEYKQFNDLVNNTAKRLRQSSLAFLTPPRLRTKGRFLSIGRLGKWGKKILDVLSGKKHDQDDEILEKLQATLPDFESVRPFIMEFAKTTETVAQVMKVLKNKGLGIDTYTQCKKLTAPLPNDTEVKLSLETWLDTHMEIQKRISKNPLPISSDVIESLFGRFKHIIGRSPQADMNRSVLIIPALCGKLDATTVCESLRHAPHAELKAWEAENIPYTMRKKRQMFFQNIEPKSGKCISPLFKAISTA